MKKMSFYTDWWMLIGLGIVYAVLCRTFYKEDSFLKYWLSIITLVVFYVISIALLCELDSQDNIVLGTINEWIFGILKSLHPVYFENHPDATSCEFMFSSGQEWIKQWNSQYTSDVGGLGQFIGVIIKTEVPFNSLQEMVVHHPMYLFGAICLFCCYPGFLYLGMQLGFLLFGRKRGDKGVLGFL